MIALPYGEQDTKKNSEQLTPRVRSNMSAVVGPIYDGLREVTVLIVESESDADHNFHTRNFACTRSA